MKDIIYNPLTFKTPSGSINNSESSVLDVLVRKGLYETGINFCIYSDQNETFTMKTHMKKVGEIGSYIKYTVYLDKFEVGIYYYYFEIKFGENNVSYISNFDYNAEISDRIIPWQLTVFDKGYKTPDWVKGGIMYQIFPDRFKKDDSYIPSKTINEDERIIHSNWKDVPNSSFDTENYAARDFYKGNLDGILSEKEYFESLNIDMIYLNPVFESSENHRYSTADYYNIDPYLGTNDIFEHLCSEFKKSNINIILDGVFSHTGSDSKYFNKKSHYSDIGAYNSLESKYYPWFKFIEYPDKYDSWWGFDNLPTVNKENKDFRDFICKPEDGVLNYWQNKGIKGWRLDVVDELPDIFVDEIRTSMKEKDPDSFLIGEVWEDASNKFSYGYRRKYLLGDQLDSVMNYPWKFAIIDFMKNKNADLFASRLMTLINNYPRPALDCLMNILSTHDTERIITVLGTDIGLVDNHLKKDFKLEENDYEKAKNLEKFASFLQFTLPGIPSIYYGDEIGMQGFSDPFNRACFDRDNEDIELLDHYRKLCDFRRRYRYDFKSGFTMAFHEGNVISYYRNNILCIVNMCNDPIIFEDKTYGEWVFGNKKPFFTDYGIVVGPQSYTAININE